KRHSRCPVHHLETPAKPDTAIIRRDPSTHKYGFALAARREVFKFMPPDDHAAIETRIAPEVEAARLRVLPRDLRQQVDIDHIVRGLIVIDMLGFHLRLVDEWGRPVPGDFGARLVPLRSFPAPVLSLPRRAAQTRYRRQGRKARLS